MINATGVIVHTNLGRAPLAQAAREAVARAAEGYGNLELDLDDRGARLAARPCRRPAVRADRRRGGDRGQQLRRGGPAGRGRARRARPGDRRLARPARGDRRRLPGARRDRAGGRAAGRGGDDEPHAARRLRGGDRAATRARSCARIPPTSASSGSCRRSRSRSCASSACRSSTTSAPACWPTSIETLREEPAVRRSVRAGAALVCFSGDKLLGGPQAGLMVGRADAVAAARKHPLARALRLDKLGLAALEATLQLYRDPERARREIPVLAMLTADEDDAARARGAAGRGDRRAEVVPAVAKVGGGALPLLELPGPAVAVDQASPTSSRPGCAPPTRRSSAGSRTAGCCSTRARSPTRSSRSSLARWHDDARHGRPHRPRQDRAGAGAHRRRHRPAARGARARDLDRARLRAAGAAVGAAAVGRRRARPRAVRAHDGGRARPGSTCT